MKKARICNHATLELQRIPVQGEKQVKSVACWGYQKKNTIYTLLIGSFFFLLAQNFIRHQILREHRSLHHLSIHNFCWIFLLHFFGMDFFK